MFEARKKRKRKEKRFVDVKQSDGVKTHNICCKLNVYLFLLLLLDLCIVTNNAHMCDLKVASKSF